MKVSITSLYTCGQNLDFFRWFPKQGICPARQLQSVSINLVHHIMSHHVIPVWVHQLMMSVTVHAREDIWFKKKVWNQNAISNNFFWILVEFRGSLRWFSSTRRNSVTMAWGAWKRKQRALIGSACVWKTSTDPQSQSANVLVCLLVSHQTAWSLLTLVFQCTQPQCSVGSQCLSKANGPSVE